MHLSPSEAVLMHPSRFHPADSDLASGVRLAKTAGVASVLALLEQDTVEIQQVSWPVLDMFGVGRRLMLHPTQKRHAWPTGSLEEALQVVTHASVNGIDLAEAIRSLTTPTGRIRPDLLGFVRRGLASREDQHPGDEAFAAEVAAKLDRFRDEDPELWSALQRELERGCRPSLRRHAIMASRDPAGPVPRRGARRNFLSSWERLNRDPPSAKPR